MKGRRTRRHQASAIRKMGPGGHDGFLEGAMTTMLGFKRLTALAVTIGAILAGAGIALAGDGQPSPWQWGSVTAVSDWLACTCC